VCTHGCCVNNENLYFQRRIFNVHKTDIVVYFPNQYASSCLRAVNYACLKF